MGILQNLFREFSGYLETLHSFNVYLGESGELLNNSQIFFFNFFFKELLKESIFGNYHLANKNLKRKYSNNNNINTTTALSYSKCINALPFQVGSLPLFVNCNTWTGNWSGASKLVCCFSRPGLSSLLRLSCWNQEEAFDHAQSHGMLFNRWR